MKDSTKLNEENFNKIKELLESFTKFKLSYGIFNHHRAEILRKHEEGIGVKKREFIKKSIDLHKDDFIDKNHCILFIM